MLVRLKTSGVIKLFLLAFILIIQVHFVTGQNAKDRALIRQKTNVEILEKIAAQSQANYQNNLIKAARQKIAEQKAKLATCLVLTRSAILNMTLMITLRLPGRCE